MKSSRSHLEVIPKSSRSHPEVKLEVGSDECDLGCFHTRTLLFFVFETQDQSRPTSDKNITSRPRHVHRISRHHVFILNDPVLSSFRPNFTRALLGEGRPFCGQEPRILLKKRVAALPLPETHSLHPHPKTNESRFHPPNAELRMATPSPDLC